QLKIDPDDISVAYSDTDHGLAGTGPGGSRYTVMVAGAIVGAASMIKEKLFRVAGHMLETSPGDLELRDGKVGVKGAPGLEKTRRDCDARSFVPALNAGRSDADKRHRRRLYLRSPVDDATLRRSFRSRYLLSDHGAHVSHAGRGS